MLNEYLLVSKKILPDYLIRVAEAQKLLQEGSYSSVSEVCKALSISRTTFYKYKDAIFQPDETSVGNRAVITMVLRDVPGVLSRILQTLSEMGVNILTISQSVPVASQADVMLSLDTSRMSDSVEELIEKLRSLKYVTDVHLITMG